ncbi:MAG: class I SAM-dependent methyltransferase [Candidatus Omnitrophica bacterium]|nr:class I SAM-dependent methyltransferase [Candidatus Omnitrophota bacterium]
MDEPRAASSPLAGEQAAASSPLTQQEVNLKSDYKHFASGAEGTVYQRLKGNGPELVKVFNRKGVEDAYVEKLFTLVNSMRQRLKSRSEEDMKKFPHVSIVDMQLVSLAAAEGVGLGIGMPLVKGDSLEDVLRNLSDDYVLKNPLGAHLQDEASAFLKWVGELADRHFTNKGEEFDNFKVIFKVNGQDMPFKDLKNLLSTAGINIEDRWDEAVVNNEFEDNQLKQISVEINGQPNIITWEIINIDPINIGKLILQDKMQGLRDVLIKAPADARNSPQMQEALKILQEILILKGYGKIYRSTFEDALSRIEEPALAHILALFKDEAEWKFFKIPASRWARTEYFIRTKIIERLFKKPTAAPSSPVAGEQAAASSPLAGEPAASSSRNEKRKIRVEDAYFSPLTLSEESLEDQEIEEVRELSGSTFRGRLNDLYNGIIIPLLQIQKKRFERLPTEPIRIVIVGIGEYGAPTVFDLAEILEKNKFYYKIVGVDINTDYIALAQEKLKKWIEDDKRNGSIDFILCDNNEFRFEGVLKKLEMAGADIIIAANVLEYYTMKMKKKATENILQILSEGGFLVDAAGGGLRGMAGWIYIKNKGAVIVKHFEIEPPEDISPFTLLELELSLERRETAASSPIDEPQKPVASLKDVFLGKIRDFSAKDLNLNLIRAGRSGLFKNSSYYVGVSALHGTLSGTLVDFAKLGGRLMPSGQMETVGVVPFVGEPGLNASAEGINMVAVSFTGFDSMRYALEYSRYDKDRQPWSVEAAEKRISELESHFKDPNQPEILRQMAERLIELYTRRIARWSYLTPEEKDLVKQNFPVVFALRDTRKYERIPVLSDIPGEIALEGEIEPEIIYVPEQYVEEVENYLRKKVSREIKVLPLEPLVFLSKFNDSFKEHFLTLLKDDAAYRESFLQALKEFDINNANASSPLAGETTASSVLTQQEIEDYAKQNISLTAQQREILEAFIEDLRAGYGGLFKEKLVFAIVAASRDAMEENLNKAAKILRLEGGLIEHGYKLTPEIVMLYRELRKDKQRFNKIRAEIFKYDPSLFKDGLISEWITSLAYMMDKSLEERLKQGKSRLFEPSIDGIIQALEENRFQEAFNIAVQIGMRDFGVRIAEIANHPDDFNLRKSIIQELKPGAEVKPPPAPVPTPERRKLTGGDILRADFSGEVWIEAGSNYYKVWIDGGKVNFQRYDKQKKAVGTIRRFDLGKDFIIGRSAGNYILPVDSELSEKHFSVSVSKNGGENIYNLKVKDLNSRKGTTVEWRLPQHLSHVSSPLAEPPAASSPVEIISYKMSADGIQEAGLFREEKAGKVFYTNIAPQSNILFGPLNANEVIYSSSFYGCIGIAFKGKDSQGREIFGAAHLLTDREVFAEDVRKLRQLLEEQKIAVEYLGIFPSSDHNTLSIAFKQNTLNIEIVEKIFNTGIYKGLYVQRGIEYMDVLSIDASGVVMRTTKVGQGLVDEFIPWSEFKEPFVVSSPLEETPSKRTIGFTYPGRLGRLHEQIAKELKQRGFKSPLVVVDLGIGDDGGSTTVELLERLSNDFRDVIVIGVDNNEEYIQRANVRMEEFNQRLLPGAKLYFVHGGFDLSKIVVNGAKLENLDLIVAANVLSHYSIRENNTIMKLLKQTLSPRGLLVVANGPGIKSNAIQFTVYPKQGQAKRHLLTEDNSDYQTWLPAREEPEKTQISSPLAAQDKGGIDLTSIKIKEMDLGKDAPKNPVDRKIYFAQQMFKQGWEVLAVLYLKQAISLLRHNVASDYQQKDLFMKLLEILQQKEYLDEEAINFFEGVKNRELVPLA